MYIHFFYITSHIAQLLHNLFYHTSNSIYQCYYDSLFTHKGAALKNWHYQPLRNWIFVKGLNYSISFRESLYVHEYDSHSTQDLRGSDHCRIRTSHVFRPWLEPGSTAWKSRALTTQPATLSTYILLPQCNGPPSTSMVDTNLNDK